MISRRTSRRWTLVRGGSSNAESAVNPTGARRPEEFRYHPNRRFVLVIELVRDNEKGEFAIRVWDKAAICVISMNLRVVD